MSYCTSHSRPVSYPAIDFQNLAQSIKPYLSEDLSYIVGVRDIAVTHCTERVEISLDEKLQTKLDEALRQVAELSQTVKQLRSELNALRGTNAPELAVAVPTVAPEEEDYDGEDACAICMKARVNITLECKHQFCDTCVAQVLSVNVQSPTCPTCRAPISPNFWDAKPCHSSSSV